jgi:hypothetical protein
VAVQSSREGAPGIRLCRLHLILCNRETLDMNRAPGLPEAPTLEKVEP